MTSTLEHLSASNSLIRCVCSPNSIKWDSKLAPNLQIRWESDDCNSCSCVDTGVKNCPGAGVLPKPSFVLPERNSCASTRRVFSHFCSCQEHCKLFLHVSFSFASLSCYRWIYSQSHEEDFIRGSWWWCWISLNSIYLIVLSAHCAPSAARIIHEHCRSITRENVRHLPFVRLAFSPWALWWKCTKSAVWFAWNRRLISEACLFFVLESALHNFCLYPKTKQSIEHMWHVSENILEGTSWKSMLLLWWKAVVCLEALDHYSGLFWRVFSGRTLPA